MTQFRTSDDNTTLTYPETSLPNLSNDEYPKWTLPPIFLQKLWNLVSQAPRTPNTNSKYFMCTFANFGFLTFAHTWLCSLSKTTFPTNGWALICTDYDVYTNLTILPEFSSRLLYLPTNSFTKDAVTNRRLADQLDILKFKATIIHQLILWEIDCIEADVDIVFFSNPLYLFDNVTDFEFQSDSRKNARFSFEPGTDVDIWELNSGFIRFKSSPFMKEFCHMWISNLYKSRLNDQQMIGKLLFRKIPMKWTGNYSFIANTESLFQKPSNMTFKYLDPMLIANCGGVFNDGKPIWIEEAKRRNIKKPVLIHFFHLSTIGQKYRRIRDNGLLITPTPDGYCPDLPSGYSFPLWKGEEL